MHWKIALAAGLSFLLVAPGVSPAASAKSAASTRERREAFDYYQEGRVGHGMRRVLSVKLDDKVTLDLVRIKAGRFRMGSMPGGRDRQPDEVLHDVQITHDFYLGKYEVTRGQFRAFVKETGYITEGETDDGGWGYDEKTNKFVGRTLLYSWKNVGYPQTDEEPVVNVSWKDATAFCEWLTRKLGRPARLPTEAEWEYAARAGSDTPYYSGSEVTSLARVGNLGDETGKRQFKDWWRTLAASDGYVFSSPVGTFPPNRFGVHDMHGNVWEWAQDWYGPYEGLAAKDPVQVKPTPNAKGETFRIMRGGGWGKRTPRTPSLSMRQGGGAISRDIDLGFRVAVSLK